METQHKQFLIGLPGNGKTTFLAALWYVLFAKEVDTALKFVRLSTENAHLNRIAKLWADVQPVERTFLGVEKYVSMFLKVPRSSHEIEIVFPDLSGESFVAQWKDRQMKSEHAELIREALGGLLLIHPEKVIDDYWITEIAPLADAIRPEERVTNELPISGASGASEASGNSAKPVWDPQEAPTQMQLVDLLQFVAALNNRRPIRLAVVVSAWDRINENHPPESWVELYLPLLWQYLRSNPETFVCAFYGVSAQGGALEDADRLRKTVYPSHRIRVVKSGESESHDITAPVRWVMG